MRVTYVGPHDAVEIPVLNLATKRGEPIEVPNDIGHELVKQSSWETANVFKPKPDNAEDKG